MMVSGPRAGSREEARLCCGQGLRNSSGEDWVLAAPGGDWLPAEMNTPIRWLERVSKFRKSSSLSSSLTVPPRFVFAV